MNENIPARFFLDLAMNVSAPNHSSLHVLRQRLIETDVEQQLEAIFDGLLMGTIQLVDSVHTQADVNAEKDKEREKKGANHRATPMRGWYTRVSATWSNLMASS